MQTFSNAPAYPVEFLDSAQNVLGEAFDWVANSCGDSLEQFAARFASSPVGKLFERGAVKYTMGVNGAELANAVQASLGLSEYDTEPEFWLDKSPEYWVGYILAQFQCLRNISFADILRRAPVGKLLGLYALGHEQDDEKTLETLNEWVTSK